MYSTREAARWLTTTGRPTTPNDIRQALHRARKARAKGRPGRISEPFMVAGRALWSEAQLNQWRPER